ncbi:MAG: Coenzyme F420 hydrogenase/dehydrogenase, beta subunit C-terminal domain [Rhodobacteraceae bacterium]|nr:Coenzyme F420 hydrogenase/dehydrogenase, beta subunit C-terminal domain [Paracoccaceae bacterium]
MIRMIDDPENGRRPVVRKTPQGRLAADKAIAVCAGVGSDWTALQTRDHTDEEWGPVLATWEGWAQDLEIRHKGSSGGAVTALAEFALTSGTASGVAHIAARRDDPRLNEAVISLDRAGIMRGTGSRYAQASAAETLGAIAAQDQPMAFVGKPCDVATVTKAIEAGAVPARNIALTIAIFCAGTPTLLATQSLLDRLQVPKTARLTDLRYRGNGWPGLMQAEWQDTDGTRRVSRGIPYAEGWGGILQSSRRWRCRVCTDHSGAFADISVGDPWHAPPQGDTDAGRSLIVARTERGRAFVEQAIKAGVLIAEPRSRDVIALAQPNLKATHGAAWARRLSTRVIGLSAPRDHGQKLVGLWLALSTKQKIQSVLGTWKRVLRDRLWRSVRVSETPQ